MQIMFFVWAFRHVPVYKNPHGFPWGFESIVDFSSLFVVDVADAAEIGVDDVPPILGMLHLVGQALVKALIGILRQFFPDGFQLPQEPFRHLGALEMGVVDVLDDGLAAAEHMGIGHVVEEQQQLLDRKSVV